MSPSELDILRERTVALEREVERQRSLVEASHILHSTLDQDVLLGLILATAQKAVDVERGTVYLLSADGQEIWSRVTAGTEQLVIRLPLGKGIAGTVAKTGETIRIDDAYADPRFDPSTDKRSGFVTRSILCTPIRNRKGETVGVFQLLNRRGGPFDDSDLEYLDALSIHASLAIENARLHTSALEKERQDREIEVAQEIQRALLPAELELELGRFSLAGLNELCEDASGDYYDFIEVDAGRYVVAVGDVSGHGLGSALVMAEARALLRAFAKTVADLPSAITMLNDFLARDMTSGKFMSMFIGVLDPANGRFEWCSAGHNPPFHWQPATGTIGLLDSTGPVLGVVGGMEYTRGEEVTLAADDVLLMYTDGATEAVAPDGEQFGEERLQGVLKSTAAAGPKAVLHAVREALMGWTGGAKFKDDLTLVAIRAGASPGPSS